MKWNTSPVCPIYVLCYQPGSNIIFVAFFFLAVYYQLSCLVKSPLTLSHVLALVACNTHIDTHTCMHICTDTRDLHFLDMMLVGISCTIHLNKEVGMDGGGSGERELSKPGGWDQKTRRQVECKEIEVSQLRIDSQGDPAEWH